MWKALLTLLVLGSAAALPARSETSAERIGFLFKEICVASPEAMMANGERFAAAGQWKLVAAGRAPLPLMHNDSGPPFSEMRSWQLELPQSQDAKLVIFIAGPDLPGVRHSLCGILVSVPEFMTKEIASEVERQLGSSLIERMGPRTNVKRTWYFKQEASHGYCGKSIMLSEDIGPPKGHTLSFFDALYPDDGKWDVLIDALKCRF